MSAKNMTIFLVKLSIDIVGLLASITTNSHIDVSCSLDRYLLLGLVIGESDIKHEV